MGVVVVGLVILDGVSKVVRSLLKILNKYFMRLYWAAINKNDKIYIIVGFGVGRSRVGGVSGLWIGWSAGSNCSDQQSENEHLRKQNI